VSDYCTTSELKAHLRIDDSVDDTELAAVITATSRAIDQHCGQFFYSSAGSRVYTPTSPGWVATHPVASTSGLSVVTGTDGSFSTSWTLGTDYVLKPDNGRNDAGMVVPYTRLVAVGSKGFPCLARPTVQVTATFGWASVPDAVNRACLIKAARVFRRRDTPEGIAGGVEFGAIRVSSREDPDAAMLLAPYCNPLGAPVVFG
jgi:hypothetical protein